MKLLRIVAVAALTAFGGITGGTRIVHATPATGVLLGAPAREDPANAHHGGSSPRQGLLLLQASLLASILSPALLSPALLASALLVNNNRHLSIINLSCN
jgi:hypothetical protein